MDLVQFRHRRVNAAIVPKLKRWLAGHNDVMISSAYRSERHNRAVGGARHSWHLTGRAVDVVGPRPTLDHLEQTARSHGAVEVLRESDHLHAAF